MYMTSFRGFHTYVRECDMIYYLAQLLNEQGCMYLVNVKQCGKVFWWSFAIYKHSRN